MSDIASRLSFDPSAATVVRTPTGKGYGYWTGGHKVWHDAATGTFALFYRERAPLEAGRGGRCAVALSEDGTDFTDVWSATKDDFAANSIEVGHCVRHDDGEWRLYVSYEYAADRRWRIDVIRAPEPAAFDSQSRRTVLHPADYGFDFLKDPIVTRRGGDYYVYLSGPPRLPPPDGGDVVTAAPRDATLLGASPDGLYFPQLRYVFEAPGGDSWHGNRARINSLVPWDGGWVATFDGGRTSYDNYEEHAGLATSHDGMSFERIDTDEPWLRSPHGCVRYVYGQRVDDRIYFYFEYTRDDLSHDLRVAVVEL